MASYGATVKSPVDPGNEDDAVSGWTRRLLVRSLDVHILAGVPSPSHLDDNGGLGRSTSFSGVPRAPVARWESLQQGIPDGLSPPRA